MQGRGGIRVICGTKRRPVVIASVGVMALASVGLTAMPAAADGSGVVWVDGSSVVYLAGDSDNNVRITQGAAGATEFVIEDIIPIRIFEGCFHANDDRTRVVCTVPAEANLGTQAWVRLQGGDDTLWLRAGTDNYVSGGDGHDTLDVTSDATVYGKAGNDWLIGGWRMYGGAGADDLRESGDDSKVFGGAGNDYLFGTDGAEILYGGSGRDTILAGGGADTVFGSEGRDELYGGRGNDDLSGGTDDDTIYGNSGNDRLRGDRGADVLSGGPGTDTVLQGS